MRVVLLLLMCLLLPSVQTAKAQDIGPSPITPPLPALATVPGTAIVSANASAPFAAASPAERGRDHGKGALIGLAAGALVGGVGFAGMNYAFTTSGPRDEYTVLSLFLGGAVGGVAGAIVGGIIGMPEREEPGESRSGFTLLRTCPAGAWPRCRCLSDPVIRTPEANNWKPTKTTEGTAPLPSPPPKKSCRPSYSRSYSLGGAASRSRRWCSCRARAVRASSRRLRRVSRRISRS